MDAFEKTARDDVESRILALLVEHFGPELARAPATMALALVQAAVAKSGSYGMCAARDAFRFAVLMIAFGSSFDVTEPWARRILGERQGDAPVADWLYREGLLRVEARERGEETRCVISSG